MNVVSDSALTCSTVMAGRILNPLKEGDLNRILPSIRSSARTITSVWQAAECAMGSVETVYHQLKLPLPYNPQLRLRINNLFRVARYCVLLAVSSTELCVSPRYALIIDGDDDTCSATRACSVIAAQ
ncbi:hypothetical protein F444_00935 [Phytophthora nicotianae P1976]|uniref:DDE Tnp4 domain-containing protein n=1 Tax=Phytophthora nicotianae P1976 TaxID=1317066 RepID=A0A081B2F3_PHYNI|nr:hypothetical protein F444_00935 [Phytophthora nicotianae P1976]